MAQITQSCQVFSILKAFRNLCYTFPISLKNLVRKPLSFDFKLRDNYLNIYILTPEYAYN